MFEPLYEIDERQSRMKLRVGFGHDEWDAVVAALAAKKVTSLDASGQLTDRALECLSRAPHLTHLNFSGTKLITDAGLQHLAGLPNLQELDLSEYPGGQITDCGLEVLRRLPRLRRFDMMWSAGISDAGAANLAFCPDLEHVAMMGTHTGDGVVKAVAGKPRLRHLRTGRLVTDAAIPLLHEIPVFKTWHGGEARYSLMEFDAEPNHLLLDGPFTNRGIERLVGLDGLFSLNFFWHTSALTADGLSPLVALPRLHVLGCDGTLCDDTAMRHIATLPHLRMLMAQGAVATDNGFAALSKSRTIEYFWGRKCPNLTSRGFVALAQMPALRGLAVSCGNVDDAALEVLPQFAALRALLPMDVTDAGFRHIGKCDQLEELWCMYCRDTTDVATEHIGGLRKLRTYYAGETKITNRSLMILSRMPSLEKIHFSNCAGISDSGVERLAVLPRLREIQIEGCPRVSRDVTTMFPVHVRVDYSA